MLCTDMSPFLVYVRTDLLPVLKNLIEVDSKNFDLLNWHFEKEKMTCSMINEIETIITYNILDNFDEYHVEHTTAFKMNPKLFFQQVLNGQERKGIIELKIMKSNPKILRASIHDSASGQVQFDYDFFASDKEEKVAGFPKITSDLSFNINSSLFHKTLKRAKKIDKKIEIIVKNNSVYFKCGNDFQTNFGASIGEHENTLLFSEKEEVMNDISCNFGKFSIDTFNHFQKLINFSYIIEVRLTRTDGNFPILLVYDIGSLGKKYVIIKPEL